MVCYQHDLTKFNPECFSEKKNVLQITYMHDTHTYTHIFNALIHSRIINYDYFHLTQHTVKKFLLNELYIFCLMYNILICLIFVC